MRFLRPVGAGAEACAAPAAADGPEEVCAPAGTTKNDSHHKQAEQDPMHIQSPHLSKFLVTQEAVAGHTSTHRRTGARWGPRGACPDVAPVIWTAIWYTEFPPRPSQKTAKLGLHQRILYHKGSGDPGKTFSRRRTHCVTVLTSSPTLKPEPETGVPTDEISSTSVSRMVPTSVAIFRIT